MPRFFFDYRDGQGGLERDSDGIEFPSLEAAYADAAKAAIDMHTDACCEGQRATEEAFEIHDEAGRLLVVVPFGEALLRRRSG
ncbi:MAG: hypothetical protein JOZ94_04520 [Xanthobacteraceae bacterium]|nr:hypothetical protein [Xanthobacteraceae bacterium]MBV9627641.1 hypothetical protein [Xanthobacteraceae bacterium]